MKNKMPAGGKREGAGRPKSDPTETVSFRVHKESLDKAREIFGRGLNRKVNDFIKRLARRKT